MCCFAQIKTINIQDLIADNPVTTYVNLKYALEHSLDVDTVKFSTPTGDSTIYLQLNPVGEDATPIIAPRMIDGNGWTIRVRNNVEWTNPWLFYIRKNNADRFMNMHITPEQIDEGRYPGLNELSPDKWLLIICDSTEWVYRTDENDNSSKYRSDAILVENGLSNDLPIASYNNAETALSYYAFKQNGGAVGLKNLSFVRDTLSSKKIGLVTIRGYDNVQFENILVKFNNNHSYNPTPHTTAITGDAVFYISECNHVKLNDVKVLGTYSTETQSGYAFSLNTVSNITFNHVQAEGEWGVMCGYNLNNILITESKLNRFDIHCYGKNAQIINTEFSNSISANHNFNRVGSFFGQLNFKNCLFNNFVPIRFDPSFHIYTGFDLILNGCIINNHTGVIVEAVQMDTIQTLLRPSLQELCWPNVHIRNLLFENLSRDTLNIFHLYSSRYINTPISYVKHVSVNFNGAGPSYTNFCNFPVVTKEKICTRSGRNDIVIGNLPSHIPEMILNQ